MPYFTIVWVCPPHTSMSVQGRVVLARMSCSSCRAATGSRYSSRYFIILTLLEVAQFVHRFKESKYLLSLFFVDARQCETHVHQRIVAHFQIGNVSRANGFAYSSEIDFAHLQAVIDVKLSYFSRDSQTHRMGPRVLDWT